MTFDIARNTVIDESNLTFQASRSSGPGGQNVNKVNTKVEVLFDVTNCPALSAWQKQRLHQRLANRIDKLGVLHVVAQDHRTQAANRQAATERLVELLRAALKTLPPRKKTRPTAGSRERRLTAKKHRSQQKTSRRQIVQ